MWLGWLWRGGGVLEGGGWVGFGWGEGERERERRGGRRGEVVFLRARPQGMGGGEEEGRKEGGWWMSGS